MNYKQTLLALILLLFPQATRPINFSQTPLLLGAAATAGVALYLVHSAYTAHSPKQVSEPKAKEPESKEVQRERIIKEAEQLINANHYANDLALICSNGNLETPSAFTEQALHSIVLQLIKSDSSHYYAPAAINDIQKILTDLNSVKTKLKQHIPFIAAESSSEGDTAQEAEPVEVDTITPLIDVLDGKITVLNKLCAFFRTHAHYMNLVQKESVVYKAYRSIIKIIDQAALDDVRSATIIHLLAADYNYSSYPYLEAYQGLKENIKNLYIKLDATDKTVYPQQTHSAQTLLDKLEVVEGLLITSSEIMNYRMRKEDQRLVKEKQDLEKAWKEKEFNLLKKQQQLERDWQRKAETMYEKAQRETQKIAREKQALEKEWKEKEFRLIEKQQKLEREWHQQSDLHAEQLTKEYRVVKAALEALSARMDAVEKGHPKMAAQ